MLFLISSYEMFLLQNLCYIPLDKIVCQPYTFKTEINRLNQSMSTVCKYQTNLLDTKLQNLN